MSQLKLGDIFGWSPEETVAHEEQVARVKDLADKMRAALKGLSDELGCEPGEVVKLLQRRIDRRKERDGASQASQ